SHSGCGSMIIAQGIRAGSFAFVVLFITLAPASAQTQTLVLSAQGTTLKLDANNYSAETVLTTYTWPNNRIANVAVLKFDLSSVPSGAVVTDATLSLGLVQSDIASGTYSVSVHKLRKDPDVTRATGYTADGVNGWTPNGCCYQGVPLAQADISAAYD